MRPNSEKNIAKYKIKGKVGIRPHQKTIKRFRDKIRQLTSKTRQADRTNTKENKTVYNRLAWILCDM